MARKYFWLKLKADFFNQKEIKLLRKIAGGDTYTIIYLKMLLKSLQDEGKLFFESIGDDFAEELALDLDEEPENVSLTISYLVSKGLLEIVETDEYFLNRVPEMVGSETASARRVRKHREKKALQSNSEETPVKQIVNTEIEIDIEKDIEKKENSRKRRQRVYEHDSIYFILAEELLKQICQNQEIKKPNLQAWADDVRKMIEIDNRTEEQVMRMIHWSQKNDFWSTNILSAKKLREKYDTMAAQANRDFKKSSGNRAVRIEKLPDFLSNPPKEPVMSPEREAELNRKLEQYLSKESTNENKR